MDKGDKYEPVRKEGLSKLRQGMQSPDAGKMEYVDGRDARNIDTIVRGLHGRLLNDEELTSEEHKTLSDYHGEKARLADPYSALEE